MTTNSNTVKTWRERIGANADFPLHAPTDVERAMEAEIAELRAHVRPAGPALSNIAALIADDSYAMTFQTFGQYRSALLKALAESPSAVNDATAEMLDMLGRIEPLAMHDKKDREQWYERLCRARAVQQPLPVPDQAAVVWRSDLVRAVAELMQLRAYRDHVRAERALKDTGQKSDAARDVLAERHRQVEQKGYDPQHDDAHPNGEIAAYAAFYAMPPACREWPAEDTGYGDNLAAAIVPHGRPIPVDGDRRRELVKAGALILAEIERMDRAQERAAS